MHVSKSPIAGGRRLDYLCLQWNGEGQAGYAHVHEIVAGLQRRGWEVRLIQTPAPHPGRLDGVRRLVALGSTQLRYWAACRFRPAEFVYVRDHFGALPTAALARAAGSTVVQEVNGPVEDVYDAWPGLRVVHRLLELSMRLQFRLADAVITVTPGLGSLVERLTGRLGGWYVVGNGADTERFRPCDPCGERAGRPYITFIGVLASWQGIGVALDAVESDCWPRGVDLVVAGDGKERARVEAAARRNPAIQWRGAISYRESAALLAGSVAALVPKTAAPSTAFGLSPLKLYEAMACGVPVVASALPGLVDTIERHGCGLVFQPGDAQGLAHCVADLVEHPDRAREMGCRGRAAAVAEYSWDVRARETEAVLLAGAMRRAARRARSRRGPAAVVRGRRAEAESRAPASPSRGEEEP